MTHAHTPPRCVNESPDGAQCFNHAAPGKMACDGECRFGDLPPGASPHTPACGYYEVVVPPTGLSWHGKHCQACQNYAVDEPSTWRGSVESLRPANERGYVAATADGAGWVPGSAEASLVARLICRQCGTLPAGNCCNLREADEADDANLKALAARAAAPADPRVSPLYGQTLDASHEPLTAATIAKAAQVAREADEREAQEERAAWLSKNAGRVLYTPAEPADIRGTQALFRPGDLHYSGVVVPVGARVTWDQIMAMTHGLVRYDEHGEPWPAGRVDGGHDVAPGVLAAAVSPAPCAAIEPSTGEPCRKVARDGRTCCDGACDFAEPVPDGATCTRCGPRVAAVARDGAGYVICGGCCE